ncbi:conserved hypothetical protein [Trichinella spiralis]|uniref:hypothetical protein n=1 Tax=Trichinella spiralis TaxID=6334 RepID=UPI0001EFD877|nr:conserved hypothetical protein [Trichinella spiralis]
MTVSHTLDRIPEQDSQLCAISQILNLRNDGSLSLMDSYYYQKILWNRRHAFPCHIIITLLMPQNNDEHGGSGRNFLQVVSSRMAAVSSTALELLSKSGRWIVLVLPLFFNVSSPSAFFKTVETIWHNVSIVAMKS